MPALLGAVSAGRAPSATDFDAAGGGALGGEAAGEQAAARTRRAAPGWALMSGLSTSDERASMISRCATVERMLVRFMAPVSVLVALAACNNSPAPSPSPSAASSASTASATAPAASATTSATPSATALKEGDAAPDVEMTMQDGKKVKLSSLKGQNVVVYFYPKDQTQGCTIEAQNFRDRFDDLKKAGITVIGVSTQDAASHKAFIDKEKLPFDLAVDEDKSLARAFGVPLLGAGFHARQTFLIGKDGKLKKIWRDVQPKDHADEVLNAAKA